MNETAWPEALTMGEACKVAGVSPRTFRRWIESGHLHDSRTEEQRREPVSIASAELRAYLARLPAPSPKVQEKWPLAPTAPSPAPTVDADRERALLEGQVNDLRATVDDLRLQRNRLQARVEDLERKLEEEREARLSLERSSGSLFGVRALLRSGYERARGRR
jgi:excisionase family DNA binding protein